MAVCINCHIVLQPCQQPYEYFVLDLSPDLVLITEEWSGHEISENDRLCQQCVHLIIQELHNRNENSDHGNRQLGHLCVCISCGISLSSRTGRRRFSLLEGSTERNFIENHIFPRLECDKTLGKEFQLLQNIEKEQNITDKPKGVLQTSL